MLRTTLFCSVLLFFSCNSTTKAPPPSTVNLVQKLESVIFTDSIPHPGGYSEILSEIDSLGLVDAIGDLERMDSMIVCKWVEPDKEFFLFARDYFPFYSPIRREVSETIFSLRIKKNELITDREKYDFALSYLNKSHFSTNCPSRVAYEFILKNSVTYAPFIKNSILNRNESVSNKKTLLTALWITLRNNEDTQQMMTEYFIEIHKSIRHEDIDGISQCRLFYSLGDTKTDIAKEYLLSIAKEEESNKKDYDCIIYSLKDKFGIDI